MNNNARASEYERQRAEGIRRYHREIEQQQQMQREVINRRKLKEDRSNSPNDASTADDQRRGNVLYPNGNPSGLNRQSSVDKHSDADLEKIDSFIGSKDEKTWY